MSSGKDRFERFHARDIALNLYKQAFRFEPVIPAEIDTFPNVLISKSNWNPRPDSPTSTSYNWQTFETGGGGREGHHRQYLANTDNQGRLVSQLDTKSISVRRVDPAGVRDGCRSIEFDEHGQIKTAHWLFIHHDPDRITTANPHAGSAIIHLGRLFDEPNGCFRLTWCFDHSTKRWSIKLGNDDLGSYTRRWESELELYGRVYKRRAMTVGLPVHIKKSEKGVRAGWSGTPGRLHGSNHRGLEYTKSWSSCSSIVRFSTTKDHNHLRCLNLVWTTRNKVGDQVCVSITWIQPGLDLDHPQQAFRFTTSFVPHDNPRPSMLDVSWFSEPQDRSRSLDWTRTDRAFSESLVFRSTGTSFWDYDPSSSLDDLVVAKSEQSIQNKILGPSAVESSQPVSPVGSCVNHSSSAALPIDTDVIGTKTLSRVDSLSPCSPDSPSSSDVDDHVNADADDSENTSFDASDDADKSKPHSCPPAEQLRALLKTKAGNSLGSSGLKSPAWRGGFSRGRVAGTEYGNRDGRRRGQADWVRKVDPSDKLTFPTPQTPYDFNIEQIFRPSDHGQYHAGFEAGFVQEYSNHFRSAYDDGLYEASKAAAVKVVHNHVSTNTTVTSHIGSVGGNVGFGNVDTHYHRFSQAETERSAGPGEQ